MMQGQKGKIMNNPFTIFTWPHTEEEWMWMWVLLLSTSMRIIKGHYHTYKQK